MILSYGPSSEQIIEVLPSRRAGSKGTAVLIHGGYWRPKFDLTLMHPLCEDLVERGWAVANVEYRRMGTGGGWPTTVNDIQTAIGFVREHASQIGVHGPLVGIGHSVGGQLALLAAPGLDAVVALAPVTDVARTEREGLGENAAREFMGVDAMDAPGAYRAASPVSQLPLRRPLLLVHGDVDVRVPVEHSTDYYAAAIASGDVVTMRIVPGLSHLDAIRPEAAHWPAVVRWLNAVRCKPADT